MFTEKGFFALKPEQFAEMFKMNDFSDAFKPEQFAKVFEQFKIPGVDSEALIRMQKKNMDALVAANKAAAAGYQDLFKRQVSLFEQTMASAQEAMASINADVMTAEGASRQADLVKTAFEKALKSMTELAEAAQQANKTAFDVVATRVQESVEEMKALAPKA